MDVEIMGAGSEPFQEIPKQSEPVAVRLRKLMNQTDRVVPVLHPPSATVARIMEQAGCEIGFVGTGGVVGSYTGLADVGTLTMMECVTVAGWIAQSVKFPIIMDGDTGHGGIMAVRRMVRECIRAGVAGVRIDDQPLEGKRRTGDAGVEVVPLDQAIARYRAAVDMKNELDPNFVIMAQCYARDAVGSDLQTTVERMKAYREEAGVDWVQLESPAFSGRNPAGAPSRARAILLHEGQTAALPLIRGAFGSWRQPRMAPGLYAPHHLGCYVGFHAGLPIARHCGIRRLPGITQEPSLSHAICRTGWRRRGVAAASGAALFWSGSCAEI